ncbi:MAG: antibiotic biosynthesis monooxygenase [Planctomycetaceae bacterium]|jgi:quinol monooxygenase YgiN|nr:antibiotic biosynthesis monooxygenase [Planctomycetaceae bacterium]
MFIYIVNVNVKAEFVEEFKAESLNNACNTVREPDNIRFDVLQNPDDPSKFVLYEVYKDAAGLDAHKQTAHYAHWKSAVEPWMAEPRQAVKFAPVFFTET